MKEADAAKPNMGLQTWDEDNEHPLQADATNSKNYLGNLQLEDLNRLVAMVLDFFEDQTKRGWLVTMEDADAKLEEILTVNKRKMLRGFGSASAEDAEKHVKAHYKAFDKARRLKWRAKVLTELNAAAKALPRSKRKTS